MPTRNDYAKINIACKELGIDKYNLLADRYGLESSKNLTAKQVVDLLDHFRRLGWKVKRGSTGQRKGYFIKIQPGPLALQKRYILALWKALGYKMPGIHTRCKTQFSVDRFEWLDDIDALQTLAKDLHNRCLNKGIDPSPK
jgi:hypothetical protein